MKAISAIIGTILILMITLALVSIAYFYIFGIYTTKTLVIEGVGIPTITKEDPLTSCSITWRIRNLAADTISVTISKVSTDACTLSTTSPSNMVGGASLDITATACAQGQQHVFKAAGPSNTVNLIAYCA